MSKKLTVSGVFATALAACTCTAAAADHATGDVSFPATIHQQQVLDIKQPQTIAERQSADAGRALIHGMPATPHQTYVLRGLRGAAPTSGVRSERSV